MTSYIDAGSIVAGAAGLSLWQAYLGMDGFQMGGSPLCPPTPVRPQSAH